MSSVVPGTTNLAERVQGQFKILNQSYIHSAHGKDRIVNTEIGLLITWSENSALMLMLVESPLYFLMLCPKTHVYLEKAGPEESTRECKNRSCRGPDMMTSVGMEYLLYYPHAISMFNLNQLVKIYSLQKCTIETIYISTRFYQRREVHSRIFSKII